MNTLSDNLANLEHDIKLFPASQHVEVTVWVRINQDVPSGFTEVESSVSDYEAYEKTVDAELGAKTKSIRILIHD